MITFALVANYVIVALVVLTILRRREEPAAMLGWLLFVTTAPFIGWITDLSGPDTLMTIPGLGVPLNVLPLVMGITMFLQQKSTMTDPKQKALIYMMPGLMTFFFYSFPSGLNLYYTLFNLLTIAHQRMISTDSKDNQGKNNNTPTAPVAKKATSKRRLSRLDMMRQISKKK